ncbi:hypothetical protein [Methylobacterium terrae]|uniref:hypothetical protein n=1 Tax=Methylobacterium terrae TaxID=2202827 RepID=UPI0013A53FB8|nr:hypothetical protein [Methylobacterium terrae]
MTGATSMSRDSAPSLADIAVGVSRMLQLTLERDSNAEGYFFHILHGPFDEACYVLEDFRVAHPMRENNNQAIWHQDGKYPSDVSPCHYAFQPDEEMRASIASRPQIDKLLADRLISVFLSLSCEYAAAGTALPAGREPFRVPREYDLEIKALILLGYLDRLGELVRWNNNISSIMREIRLWDESNDLKLPEVPQVPADAQHKARNLLMQNQRIAAIKIVCDASGMTLVDAMACIKELEKI